MTDLWRAVTTGSAKAGLPAFFPRAAYVQVKAIPHPAQDYRQRLVSGYLLDLRAAHRLLRNQGGAASLVGVAVPREWGWIGPGSCANRVGYWHAPGSRLLYRQGGELRSFGIFSLISWRGQWYVVHLSSYSSPGTVDSPSAGRGTFGPPGGC